MSKIKGCDDCNKAIYCTKCGSRLVLVKTNIYQKYSADNGDEVNWHYHYWGCPNRSRIFNAHTSWDDEPWDLMAV